MPNLVLAGLLLLHDMIGNRLSDAVASVMAQMSTRSVPTLLIATFAFTLLQKATAGDNRQPAVQSETLLQASSSWDGEPYKSYPSGQPELSILKITLAPHTELEWHSHPMPSAAYIVAGELTLERQKDGKKQRFTAGQAVSETVDTFHRGVAGREPVVLIVFYAGSPGMPLAQHSCQESARGDQIVSPAYSENLVPDAKTIELNSGHLIFLEKPGELASAILSFCPIASRSRLLKSHLAVRNSVFTCILSH